MNWLHKRNIIGVTRKIAFLHSRVYSTILNYELLSLGFTIIYFCVHVTLCTTEFLIIIIITLIIIAAIDHAPTVVGRAAYIWT